MKELKLRQCRLDERYDILDCLGRGSYSEIYSATDTSAPRESAHRTVVIKALNVSLQGSTDAELDRTLLENFQNEAIALDRVRHPHIISRLGHGTAIDLDGTVFHYLVLEFLPGGDLAAVCRQQPLELAQMLFYLEQVCSGLAYAHERGVIHRDIKPQNLLLTRDGQTVKIADFGVAKIEAGEGAITRVGTNVYAPPEHSPLSTTGTLDGVVGLGPARQLTPAADIYSLAKTVYTLLAGTSPRRFSHHQITELPPGVDGHFWSKSLLRVLSRATQDDPERRYQTVQDFWDELSDAALPSTQELPVAEVSARESLSSQTLTEIRQLVAEAPPQVNFEPLKPAPKLESAPPRPRIVVAVDERQPLAVPPVNGQAARPQAKEILRTMPDADAVAERAKPRRIANTGFRRFLLGLLLLALFAGMLAATYSYFRGHGLWPGRQTGTNTTGNSGNDLVGRDGITATDVYLRSGPGAKNPQVGLAETGSQVRVLTANGDWLEVQVVQHGRTKKDPSSADRGWMIRKTASGPTINFE
jgi:serine/threonine protein kinase